MKPKINQSKLKLAIVSAMLVGSAGFSTASYANTDTMEVKTSVAMACSVSAAALTFTPYDPTAGSDQEGSAEITSTCTYGGSAKITISEGGAKAEGSSAAIPKRQMANTQAGDTSRLGYFLYQDSGRLTVLGNTEDTGKGYTAKKGDDIITVFGTIPKGQAATYGNYRDSVLVTLTY